MALPTYEMLKMVTSNGKSVGAVADVAANTGMSPREVEQMVSKGCWWLVAQASTLKAAPASLKRDAVLCAARGAWLVASARGIA